MVWITSCSGSSALLVAPASACRPPIGYRTSLIVTRKGSLRELPLITETFAAGRLSYSKVRALTRIASAATEESLLGIALHGTTAQLESVVAAARAGSDPRPAAARRGLRCTRAADGSLLVSLRIPAEQGEKLLATIEAYLAENAVEPAPDGPAPDWPAPGGSAEPFAARTVDPAVENRRHQAAHEAEQQRRHTGGLEHSPGATLDPVAARRLDALLDLVTGAVPPRPAKLVVHMRAEDGRAWIDGGPPIATSTASRLTCTDAVQALLVDRRGNPLYLGRTRRLASPQQLMALRVRDGNRCAFPGCTHTRHLEAHHLRWWQLGGPTDLDNLALICAFHHALIHDHGYRADRTPDGIVFRRPDLTPVPAAGPPTTGSADELVARHTAQQIDSWTITPHWGGEPLDRNAVLRWLVPELTVAAAA